jgi:hypothetical protein
MPRAPQVFVLLSSEDHEGDMILSIHGSLAGARAARNQTVIDFAALNDYETAPEEGSGAYAEVRRYGSRSWRVVARTLFA